MRHSQVRRSSAIALPVGWLCTCMVAAAQSRATHGAAHQVFDASLFIATGVVFQQSPGELAHSLSVGTMNFVVLYCTCVPLGERVGEKNPC
jgi:hypothetical protein